MSKTLLLLSDTCIFMIIRMRVTGIGQCALDHLFIMDSFPVPDTKKEIMDWTIAGGGPVATALVSLTRLGIDCDFYGVIGDDEAGDKIIESLQTEKIHVRGVYRRTKSNSQVAFIAVEKNTGKRTIFWQRPSGSPIKSHELPKDFLDGTDLLLVDGLMKEVSLYAAEKARERSIPVMLDAGRVHEGMVDLAHLCDYVVCSEEFAREFVIPASFEPEDAIARMKSFRAKAVTITLGDKGSVTECENNIFFTPAFEVDVMDTTGAGDVFHGGYIYGLLQKWDIKDVVRFASAFAALKCRRLGGRAGIPLFDEVKEFIAKSSAS